MRCRLIAAFCLVGLTGASPGAGARSARFLAEVPAQWKLPVRALALSPSGRLLAAGGDGKQLLLYDLKTRRTRWVSSARGPVTALAFSPDGKLLAIGWKGKRLELLDVQTGRLKRRVGPLAGIPHSLAFSPDGKLLAVAGQSQRIALYDPATGKLQSTLTGHTSWVNHVTFSDDGKTLASSGWDHAVRLWRVSDRTLLRSLRAHKYAVNAAVFSVDGKRLLSTSDDQRLRRFKVSNGRVEVSRPSKPVICLARAKKSGLVVGGGHRGHLALLHFRMKQATRLVRAHRGQVFAVAVTPRGRLAITGGRDGKIKLWKVR